VADSCGISEDGAFDYAVFGLYSGTFPHEIHFKDGTIKQYDSYGRLAAVKGPNTSTYYISYVGTSNQISSITDTINNTVSFSYVSGLLSKITLPDGNYYKFNIVNNQIESIQLYDKNSVPDFNASFVYNTSSQITDVYNSYGNQLNYQYNF
jgi:hypothetical protein